MPDSKSVLFCFQLSWLNSSYQQQSVCSIFVLMGQGRGLFLQLGNEFSLANLATALQGSRVHCAEQLAEPLQMGLIAALGDNYRYAAQTDQQER